MKHIKDYWVENEVFHASNLNEITRAINELIDKADIIINDERVSSASTYSSFKIVEILGNYGLKTAVVDVLPAVGENGTIYFVPSTGQTEQYATDEFIWCDGRWEKIGSTQIDFSNYYTKAEIDETVDAIEGMVADKADINHTHSIGEIDNLESILAGKSNTGHTHTAAEVGALPDTTVIPTKTSQLTNDSGFLTEHQPLKTINGESLVGTGDVEINVIDDETPSTQKAYSSNKIEELLQAPTVDEVIDVLDEPEPYDEGYKHGSTDSYHGETQNPHSAGTYSYTEWNNGYKDGWEDAHHYWFVYSGDAEANGVVIDNDMFTEMITSTASMSSSFEVDGVTYTTTKRSGDSVEFGNIVIPSGKTATVYLAGVSSGTTTRIIRLTNDATGYSGELRIGGGSSSLNVATLTDVPGGLTYKLSKQGENVRISAIIVKLQ